MTKIEWTDETWNPLEALEKPLRWRKPRMVFVTSSCDLFHKDVPDDFIDKVWAIMALCPQHTFQVLTKRPERAAKYWHSVFRTGAIDDEKIDIMGTMADRGSSVDAYIGEEDSGYFEDGYLSNVWLGTSIEDQATADERIPRLLECPAAVRFLSVEPMLAGVDLLPTLADSLCRECGWLGFKENDTPNGGLKKLYRGDEGWDDYGTVEDPDDDGWWVCPACKLPESSGVMDYSSFHNQTGPDPRIRWVIVGGESGPGARPMDPAWARSIRDQCVAAGVPFFFKQWGEWCSSSQLPALRPAQRAGLPYMDLQDLRRRQYRRLDGGAHMYRVGKKAAGRLLDGRTWDEMPDKP